jgi:hypothetical protein
VQVWLGFWIKIKFINLNNMKKSQIMVMPQFFDRYINIVEDSELVDGLEKTISLFDVEKEAIKRVADKRYAPGKWTPKDIIQHVIDNERIQSYRAMRISRNDKTILPGYDEELLANHANASIRTIDDLMEEFRLLRQTNILMFRNLTDEMLQRSAICYQVEISALALGFVLVGHQIHHLNVLKERYFNL